MPVAPVIRVGRLATSGVRRRARRDPHRQRRGAPRRGPAHQGRQRRPCRRHRLPREAGSQVETGEELAVVHARTEAQADEAVRDVLAAYQLADEPPDEPPGAARGRQLARGVSAGSAGVRWPHARAARGRDGPAAARAVLEGRTFVDVEINDARLTRPFDPAEVARELEGERVALVDRRGKYLIVRFESGRALLVHLRMTGSLRHGKRGTLPDDPHRRAVVRLDDGSDVAYRDVRRFGTWLLLEPAEVDAYVDARVGREPLAAAYKAKHLAEELEGSRAPDQGGDPRPANGRRASGTSTPTRRSGARRSTRSGRPPSSIRPR